MIRTFRTNQINGGVGLPPGFIAFSSKIFIRNHSQTGQGMS
jgi:hypothetical protein